MGEQVLLYRRRVRLYPKPIGQIFPDYAVAGINDIIRFNVQGFLRRMDDPTKELFIVDEDAFRPIKGTRVYHLNLILRLVHDGSCAYSRYRLILNREGIKRMEKVSI